MQQVTYLFDLLSMNLAQHPGPNNVEAVSLRLLTVNDTRR